MLHLTELNSNLQADGISWSVTEGFPPSIAHKSDCHSTGNCVDANITSPTATNINKFYDAGVKSGLKPNYEVKTEPARQALIASGVRPEIVSVNPDATAPHFHVSK
jgi:hypothetical protein